LFGVEILSISLTALGARMVVSILWLRRYMFEYLDELGGILIFILFKSCVPVRFKSLTDLSKK